MQATAAGARARWWKMGAVIALWTASGAGNAWAQNAMDEAEPVIGVEASSGTVREIKTPAQVSDTFSLRFENSPPQDVLNEFVTQAKARGITVQPPVTLGDAPVTLAVENQPFWVALQSVARQLNLEASDTASEGSPAGSSPNRIVVLRRPQTPRTGVVVRPIEVPSLVRAPSVASGPFLIAANRVSRSESLLFSTDTATPPQPTRQASLDFSVWLDPRVRLLPSSTMLKLQAADDETGRSLLSEVKPPMMGGIRFLETLGMVGFTDAGATLRLQAPLELSGARRIARLKGTLSAKIITRAHIWRLPDIAHAANAALTIVQPDSVNTYTLTKFEPAGPDSCRVEMTAQRMDVGPNAVTQPARPTREQIMARQEQQRNDPFRAGLSRNLKLIGADGREWRVSQLSYKTQGDLLTAQISFTRRPDERGTQSPQPAAAKAGPLALSLELPTATRELDMPFEFSDLPLP